MTLARAVREAFVVGRVVGANLGRSTRRTAWRRWPISCSPLRRCGGPS